MAGAASDGLLERRRCQYLHSGRAWCQMVEMLLAVLILVCSSVSGGSPGGYTSLLALGGIYCCRYGGVYSGFSGADGERAQQLDQRFHLLKLPIARAAMAMGGCLLVFPRILILVGFLDSVGVISGELYDNQNLPGNTFGAPRA